MVMRRTRTTQTGFKLCMEDVWGAFDAGTFEQVSKGMIVAQTEGTCPIFKDEVPYKSVTIVFDPKEHKEDEVKFWLTYVHGSGNESAYKELEDGRIAIRSDYTAW